MHSGPFKALAILNTGHIVPWTLWTLAISNTGHIVPWTLWTLAISNTRHIVPWTLWTLASLNIPYLQPVGRIWTMQPLDIMNSGPFKALAISTLGISYPGHYEHWPEWMFPVFMHIVMSSLFSDLTLAGTGGGVNATPLRFFANNSLKKRLIATKLSVPSHWSI